MVHFKKPFPSMNLCWRIKYSVSSPDEEKKNCTNFCSRLIRKTKSVKNSVFLGFFYTFIASIFFTVALAFVHEITYINPNQLSLVRNVGFAAGSLPLLFYSFQDVFVPQKYTVLLLIEGFVGATGSYFNLIAFRNLPIADASVIMSTAPVLCIVVASLCLKESCGRIQIVCLILSICGVLSSVRLPEVINNKVSSRLDFAYVVGLISCVFGIILLTLKVVTIRKMKDVNVSKHILYTGVIGVIENTLIHLIVVDFAQVNCGWDQLSVTLIGVFNFLGEWFLILAIQEETIAAVTIVKGPSDIIISMVIQATFFNTNIDIYNITGGCLVFASICLSTFNKYLQTLPEESKSRKKFKLFL